MARHARNRFWSDRPQTNLLHHVTNRGVDRSPLFRTAVDRIVFLSMLAAVCLDGGLRVHTFCLMTNHFHLLVEDPRGVLSHAMLRLQTAYARYFRDSAGRRGSGHVFGDRFFSRRVGSTRYYRAVVSYILRNPLACKRPLASAVEGYIWSSAAIHVSEMSSSEGCQALLAAVGGLEAAIEAQPAAGSEYLKRMRRHRLECFAGGEWLDAGAARQGLTGEEFRERMSADEPVRETEWLAVEDEDEDEGARVELVPVTLVQPRFEGHKTGKVLEALERLAGKAVAAGDAAAYALWRFARDGRKRLAKTMTTTADEVARAVSRVHELRLVNPATHEALSRLEWRMTLALGGAPWRV